MDWLEDALALAEKGRGTTAPNPMVGALIVRDERVVGRGWHERAGGPHAEIVALREAGEQARGSTLYVTLEPCSHQGRTPPCVEALLQAGVARVVVGLPDPNPRVQGLLRLREAGLQVELATAQQQERCARLNEVFLTWIKMGRPFVTMKYAMTLDGKIATRTGQARWISGPQAREWVHQQRQQHDVIVVGSQTVLLDDPRLTSRLEHSQRQPVRLVVDSRGRTQPGQRVYAQDGVRRILVTGPSSPIAWRSAMEGQGVEVWLQDSPRVDLAAVMKELAHQELTSVFLEGGGTLNASAVDAAIVDKVACFIAPRLIGGQQATTPLEGVGVEEVAQGWMLQDVTWRSVGTDLLVEGYLSRHFLPE